VFGYVRPLKGELKVSEFEAYQAAYCGLCRSLGKNFGFSARFLVSYDLTFLYCLLTAAEQAMPTRRCRCPANPLKKKNCVSGGEAMTRTAQINVLLMYHKLRDAAGDETGAKRLAAKAAMLLYGRAYKKAANDQPSLDSLIREQLDRLAALEAERCPSIDRTADAFAQILRACADTLPAGAPRRAAGETLYHVGRYLYLTDALDDLPKDAASGSYNPVALRYGVTDGVLSTEDGQALEDTIQLSISRAAAALELLEPRWSGGILRNIIYQGLPAVLQSVRMGTFQNKSHKLGAQHERSI
jgi:hypothetical protein